MRRGGGTTISPATDGGVTVDDCLNWATNRGQPVAEECRPRQGYRGASASTSAYLHPARTLRSGETCDADFRGGLTRVTCE
jgi:hypothetical protein